MRSKTEHKNVAGSLKHLGYAVFSSKTDILKAALECRKMGLAAYQVSGDFSVNFPENVEPETRRKVREFNRANNLNLHFHAPTDIPLAGRHPILRLAGIERLNEYIQLAVDMGARSFVFHPGRFAYYKIDSGKIVMAGRDVPEIYFERFLDSVKRMVDFNAGRLNLLLENTYAFSGKLIEIIDQFLSMGSTGLVWDIAHMHQLQASKNKNSDSRDIAEFFSHRIGHIKLAHIHDIAGGKGHLPLGTGILDIASFVDIISSLDIDMIIEVFSERDLMKSLDHLESLNVKK